MTSCAAKQCFNNTRKKNRIHGITYHSFPKDELRREKWLFLVRRQRQEPDWTPTVHSRLCSTHFKSEDVYTTSKGLKRVSAGAVPYFQRLVHDNVNSDVEYLSGSPGTSSQNEKQESHSTGNEIKVFCPNCNTEVSHSAEKIQEDQTKILVAKVYHYFEHEYEELKKMYGDLDLTPLSKFRQRTALATGVSETTVVEILKEEEERNADKLQEPPEKRCRARKRSRQTDNSSEENSSDDNVDDGEPATFVHVRIPNNKGSRVVNAETSSGCIEQEKKATLHNENEDIIADKGQHESEIETLVVKIEPPEYHEEQAHTDPISAEVKVEPLDDDVNNTNETLLLNEPAAGTKRKTRIIPRSDVTSTRQHTQGESPTTAAVASSVRPTEELDKSGLLGEAEVKVEEIVIEEEGFS